MITKIFEVRDRSTLIPLMCTMLDTDHLKESYLLGRGNWHAHEQHLWWMHLQTRTYGIYPLEQHQRYSTMHEAAAIIHEFWEQLETGLVIDLEWFRGETDLYKRSERVDIYNQCPIKFGMKDMVQHWQSLIKRADISPLKDKE